MLGCDENPLEEHFGALAGHLMPGIENEKGELEWTFPTQKEINEQDTDFLRRCFALYSNISLLGLPHGKGWADEPNAVIVIYKLCESEKNRYEHWKMTKAKNLEDRD